MNVTKETTPQKRNLYYRMKQEISQGLTRLTREGTDSPAPKESKRKKSAVAPKRDITKNKKSSATPRNLFTSSTLDRLNGGTKVQGEPNASGKTQLPLMEGTYGIDQMTVQKFNNEAACVFQEHRQPSLSCALNGTVILKQNGMYICVCILRPNPFGAFQGL